MADEGIAIMGAEDHGPPGRREHQGPPPERYPARRALSAFGRLCGTCGEPSSRTVLIAVAGLMLAKDVCPLHLAELLEGARESP